MQSEPPRPPGDPYRAVWQMTPVADEAGHGSKGHRVAGVVAGLIVFLPFGLVVGTLLGWWFGDFVSVEWALIVALFGALASVAVGLLVANDES